MSFTHPDHLHAAFAAAFRAGDVPTLVDLYEDDAVQVQPDGTTAGHDRLTAVFTGLLAAGLTMDGEPQRAIVAGDIALTSTHYTWGGGADGQRRVATAEVSRRQPDGSWRLVIDVPAFA